VNPKIAAEKGFNVLLYAASALQEPRNLYKILKAIYAADKLHLERYGRQIFPQQYQKLRFGNVPATSYDVLTHCRDGKRQPQMPERVRTRIKVDKPDTVIPLDKPNREYLSKSEIECLDKAIEELRPLKFEEVKVLMHDKDPAYNNDVKLNGFLSLEEHIVPTLKDAEKVLEYLKEPHPG
jgi:hypothetical protein